MKTVAAPVLIYSEHLEDDGEAMFRHACAMGLEGIVSKRPASRYGSGGATLGGRSEPAYERLPARGRS